ncbi:MAG: hypothetical protein AAGE84_11605 [Cyanobacteria bacterium P01_G01_bin.39]
MSKEKTNNQPNISIEGSTVGGFVVGNNGFVQDISIIQSLPISHPQADQIKQKLIELRKVIDGADIEDFKKNDALDRLQKLTQQLENQNNAESKAGSKYFLEQIVKIFDNAKPIVSLATSLAKLLGFSI